ncbi:MAG: MarR family winged helix-turn-helix transcriptional regulator [Acidimicrobiales bacterium]|jgi:DNA-binding MarR family transcriptional regulator
MDALDLFQLGRWLTKLGEEAMRPAGGSPSRPGRRVVLMDALAFPDSSVGEIATRTGLPQSYVSAMVAKLCELGTFETRADPADRRRTLVRVSRSGPTAVVGPRSVPVDGPLIEALGDFPPGSAAELVSALGEIAARLRAARSGKGNNVPPQASISINTIGSVRSIKITSLTEANAKGGQEVGE